MIQIVAAVVVAAGRGLRAGGGVPKQYRFLRGEPAIRSPLAAFAGHKAISLVQAVIHPDDRDLYGSATEGLTLLPPVPGGATRQASVLAGLEALASHRVEIVLVHDAARPFATTALMTRAIATAARTGAAVPVIPVVDTVKTVNETGVVTGTLERSRLRAVQTPQAFAFPELLAAHRRARSAGRDDFTDDAALAEWAGVTVSTFPGEESNVKLTTDQDFARFEAAAAAGLSDVRAPDSG
jgi:2-C-methyl-D-erythritol 4-phosphate cytidylyltransferase/2-C-methyl-D-erythritol 2,4-cyclodiphosphate synthase